MNTAPDTPAYRCSLIAKQNLMRLTGKSYQASIPYDANIIAAGDAIRLLKQGQENNTLTSVVKEDIASYLEKHTEVYS